MQLVHNKSRTLYHEFMSLDQVRSAVITYDNIDNRVFVTVKCIKRANLESLYYISDFKSDHLVNIKNMFLKEDYKIMIVYKQINMSLKHVIIMTEGLLQVFKIEMIWKKINTYTQ